jgi:hypothetical protein
MPRQESERFKLDVPFEDAIHKLLGVDADQDGSAEDDEAEDES